MKKHIKTIFDELKMPLLAILFSLSIGALLILLSGKNPIQAYSALFKGALGSPQNISQIFNKATPIIFTGLAVSIAYKTKAINIGAEGQLAVGALSTTLVGIYLKGLPAIIHVPITILAGFLAGAIWAFIPALLRVKRKVSTVITTIMMNYVAVGLVRYLITGPFKEPGELVATGWIEDSAKIPLLLKSPYRLGGGIILALIAVIALHIIINKTVLGYEVKAVGKNEEAARYSGINVAKIIFIAMMISGGLAGIAGSTEILGSFHRMYDGFSPGYGFDGIAVALLANSNPIGVVLTALLFSILRTGAITMQTSVGVSRNIVDAMQGIIILFVAAKHFFEIYGEKIKLKKKEYDLVKEERE